MTDDSGVARRARLDPLKTDRISEFCQSIRVRAGLTQEDLAKKSGITRSSISRAEFGMIERPYPHLRFLTRYMTSEELMHMMNLLRLIDIKNLSGE